MERTIGIRHVSMEVNADFGSFTRGLERSLRRFDPSLLDGLETDPSDVRERLEEIAGEGLMLFDVRDHGKLLNIAGAPGKARQYVLGNPLLAIEMTRRDIRAGLYAPLRIFVYEANGHATRVEFDVPSSLFGQFDNPEVTAMARSLDEKLAALIENAASIEAKIPSDG